MTGEPLVTVRVLRAPVLLWERASIHTAELVREFSLLMIGLRDRDGPPQQQGTPQRLVELSSDLRARYAGISEAQAQELEDCLAAGETSHDFTYCVPAGVARACQELLDLLDEADLYCERGALITLVSPADQREFRRWYLHEFVRQINGQSPTLWPGSLD